MSLIGALNIGRSALTVNQAALQVTGNNIANAGNANYTRQVANTAPSSDQQLGQGMSIGTGIDLTSIQRQIDEALEGRLRSSISDDSAASTTKQWLDRVESVFNELGDKDLSTQMSTFFSGWSTLAANPADTSQRSIVVGNGQELAKQIQGVRASLSDVQADLGSSVKSLVNTADGYAKQIADLNNKIALSEGGSGGTANSLRDQRDGVLKQLSDLVDVQSADGGGGMINVFIGSQPLVMGATSRGLTTTTTADASGQSVIGVGFKTGGGVASVTGGQVGGMLQLQSGPLQTTIGQLDSLTSNLINEVNKVYAGGQGLVGYSSVTATNAVTDPTAALDSAGLPFAPKSGSFVASVYNSAGQIVSSGLISVKLGADAGGSPTTLNSLAAALGGIGNITATVSGGKLSLATASPGLQIKFGTDDKGDTSNALASLGINTFFSGTQASDISVNQAAVAQPSLLAAGSNTNSADNRLALKIAALQTAPIDSLNGGTLTSSYTDMINQTAVASATAQNNSDATSTVRTTLESQRESLSGVSMDEEAVNLIKQQRAFQGAAKLVSAIDDMMKTVLNMVG